MSEMLKPCPFCKGEFAFDFEAKNFRCGTCRATVPPDPYARTVNTRPIEDELTARIAELREDNASLGDSNAWLKQNYEDLERDYGVMHEKMCARIDKLKGAIEILEDQQREAKNHLIDKNLHIDSLYEEGYKLQQRIAELEATVEIHADISNAYEKRISEIVSLSNKANAKLQSRIAELEMKIRHNALWQASEDAEERAHLEKLVPDLNKRIAELEGEVTKGHELQDSYCDRIAELEAERDDWRKSYINLWRHINNLPQPPEEQE